MKRGRRGGRSQLALSALQRDLHFLSPKEGRKGGGGFFRSPFGAPISRREEGRWGRHVLGWRRYRWERKKGWFLEGGEAAQSKFHFSLLHYAPGEKGKEKMEVEEEIWPSQ